MERLERLELWNDTICGTWKFDVQSRPTDDTNSLPRRALQTGAALTISPTGEAAL